MEQQKEQLTTVTIETPKEEVPKKETKIVDEPEPSTSTGAKAPRPKRGRPKGSNRTPLSQEERRARNAQYEKERREDLAKAQTELMEAAGCKSDVTTAALLAFVVTKLKKARENMKIEDSIEEYQRLNDNLEAQIASCFERLGPDFVLSEDEDEEDKEISQKRSSKSGSKPSRPRRGRPTGANRTPLSLEERRARNAQYERERREDLAQAQAELAEAAGCDPNVSEADLLAFVVNKLSADKLEVKQSIEDYRRTNADLETQIAQLEASRNAQAPPVVPSNPEPPAPPQPDLNLIIPELEQLTSQLAPLITSVLADCPPGQGFPQQET
ncbi:hypothetical protein SFRURICE_016374 [Spodoptera frugiperda]|nr:hypothetical protein SFRURICE_016374 [Spodoptera frugiperda]